MKEQETVDCLCKVDRQALKREMANYQQPSRLRSTWQLMNTLGPFGILWYAAYRSLDYSVWIALPLIVLLSGFMIRTFIVFHDCGHGSFFRSRKANDFWGMITGLMTFTPYHRWRSAHARHHGTSGNLDKRGQGDVWMMTRSEYMQASRMERVKYRLYRNPVVMFLLGPLLINLVSNRIIGKKARRSDQLSVYGTNLAVAIIVAGMVLLVGWKAFLIIQLSALFLAHIAGVWLFYVQHQFEGVYWERNADWDFVRSALEGGSFYKLPAILRWFTGSIGFHHIHHLNSRIPNYNLARCQDGVLAVQMTEPIGLLSSLKSLRFRLWDEEAGKLVGFGAARNRFNR